MATSVFPAASSASQPPILSTVVPAGVTLRQTYNSSASGLSFPVNQVYAVVIGGGGGGNSGTAGQNASASQPTGWLGGEGGTGGGGAGGGSGGNSGGGAGAGGTGGNGAVLIYY